MALYVYDKRSKQYNKLSSDAIKKIKRTQQINDLTRVVDRAAPTMHALAAWLEQVSKKGNKMTSSDLFVTRLPNCDRIKKMAGELRDAMQAARKG